MGRPKTWFEFHAAKFEADTSHLSLEEKGAYITLLDFHFLHDSIPTDLDRLKRVLGISKQKTRKIIAVLSEFFYEKDGRFYQKRMVETIAKAIEISKVRQDAANKKWDAIADANADANADTVTKTVTVSNKNTLSESKIPTCPHSEIINLYHDCLPELPRIKEALWSGSKDASNLTARWKQHKQHQSLEFWHWFFQTVRTNPHWMGQNSREWKANLRWLVNRANFTKVVERGSQ